jgi:hypothetical protein
MATMTSDRNAKRLCFPSTRMRTKLRAPRLQVLLPMTPPCLAVARLRNSNLCYSRWEYQEGRGYG